MLQELEDACNLMQRVRGKSRQYLQNDMHVLCVYHGVI
jgi:hypothetical protein